MYKHLRSSHNIKAPKESYPQWILDKCQYRVLSSDEVTALSEGYCGATIELKPFNTTISGTPQSASSEFRVLLGTDSIAKKRTFSSKQIDDGAEHELIHPKFKRTRRSTAATFLDNR
jgi:hypothetical protein